MIDDLADITIPAPGEVSIAERITRRSFAQMVAMIHQANSAREKRAGDPKVGGHPASCASAMHLLGALHLEVRAPRDYVCCKPHASPVDHALHYALGLFRHSKTVDAFADSASNDWFTAEEAEKVMYTLRAFPTPERPHVLQSYHAASDPDHWHFLPSGTVGIPPVCSSYLALAHRYADDHEWEVPTGAHFWSLIGDSEFREGSLLEAMPDVAERQLGNVTWIIDYNRQNLDGTRIPNERGLEGTDCERIERTALANGWRVIQLRHGSLRKSLFARPGGECLRETLESGVSDYEFQMLVLKRDPQRIRDLWIDHCADSRPLVDSLTDEEVLAVMLDLGGHDYARVVAALRESKKDPEVPCILIAHTLKGWGLECVAHPANHSTLPSDKEVEALLVAAGLTIERPFAPFAADSEEGRFLAQRGEIMRTAQIEERKLIDRNRERQRTALAEAGGLPETVDIDTSLFPMAHTQWMWGQIAAKLVRIGTHGTNDAERQGGGLPERELTDHEKRWLPAARFVMTLSPDVGSSTNIMPSMDAGIYGPTDERNLEVGEAIDMKIRHPELLTRMDPWTRHIRFEIAEANAMSALGAFGKMGALTGLPFVPVMTVYDFFIKRALDQLYYDVYWASDFILMGTPSGVTLSPEGAHHSWKSDIQMPNLITWEPAFTIEMDWVLSDAITRQMNGDNSGRSGVLVRAVTRTLAQKILLERVRRHVASKQVAPTMLLHTASDDEPTQGTVSGDESTMAPLDDVTLLERVRAGCLAGAWTIVDHRGYAGYELGDNVVQLFVMGALLPEALGASDALLERGIFANVHVVSSPELLLGILGQKNDYAHLHEGLAVTGDLHGVPQEPGETDLITLAARRVPCVAVCDGEAGLLDNLGSVLGVRCLTLAVRKFSKCGRPDQVYGYQSLDTDSILEACGQVLAETALEELRVDRQTLERHIRRDPATKPSWRELWDR
jgi:pyruvate dehydrogenase E1 component